MASDDPLDSLTNDERAALAELAQARANGDLSRRDLMQAGGALGVGALLGGGGAAALTGSAAADASTSDSDPDVGEPGDRVDVFAAGVDADVIDTDSVSVAETRTEMVLSTVQSISTGSDTPISFDTVPSEDSNIVVADTANNRFEIQQAGDFGLYCRATWLSDTSWSDGDFARIAIFVNGNNLVVDGQHRKQGTYKQPKDVYTEQELTAGDVVSFTALQDSGSSKDLADQTGQTFAFVSWRG